MALKTVVTHTDDLDGTAADQTVTFALDNVEYEIDLASTNATALRESLSKYINAGRRVGGSSHIRTQGTVRTDREQLDAIRRWARENGYDVAERGRISRAAREAYDGRA